MAEDQNTTNTINNGQQPTPQAAQPNTPQQPPKDSKEGSQKGMLIGLAVIAVIALLLAGFFFVSAKQAQQREEQTSQAVEEASQQAQENAAQAEREAAEREAELARQQAELEAQLESAQNAVDELNEQLEGEAQTQVEQCKVLLVTMPSDKVVTFRSDNWEVDIVKYYKDLEAEQKTYDPESDEWDNIGAQKRVTEPYSNNFMANCEDVYDEANSTIVASVAPVASPTAAATE